MIIVKGMEEEKAKQKRGGGGGKGIRDDGKGEKRMMKTEEVGYDVLEVR